MCVYISQILQCHSRQRAFTLVELLVCLAIIAIVSGYMSPSFSAMVERNRAATAINWIVTAIIFTRDSAITMEQTVTLCPSSTGHVCGGRWYDGVIAFTDANQDRHIDGSDRLLRRFMFPVKGATLSWHAFRNRQYIQMTAEGFTNYQNGNFLYCPPDNDPRFARQLVINMQGRSRLSHDRNGDGIVDDVRGHDLICR